MSLTPVKERWKTTQGSNKINSTSKRTNKTANKKNEDLNKTLYKIISNPDSSDVNWGSLTKELLDNVHCTIIKSKTTKKDIKNTKTIMI